jgi:hypothetical protein
MTFYKSQLARETLPTLQICSFPPVMCCLDVDITIAPVQSTGAVDLGACRSCDLRSGWHRDLTIEGALKAIRAEMQAPSNKRLPQPPDGQQF